MHNSLGAEESGFITWHTVLLITWVFLWWFTEGTTSKIAKISQKDIIKNLTDEYPSNGRFSNKCWILSQ